MVLKHLQERAARLWLNTKEHLHHSSSHCLLPPRLLEQMRVIPAHPQRRTVQILRRIFSRRRSIVAGEYSTQSFAALDETLARLTARLDSASLDFMVAVRRNSRIRM